MPRLRVRRLLPVLAAALGVAGCKSSTLPPEVIPGAFVLESYDGAAVPVPLGRSGPAAYTLLADTLRLEPRGVGTQVRVLHVDFDDPARPDEEQVSTETLRYEVRGGRLRVTSSCPANAVCGDLHEVGTYQGDALVLHLGADVLVYRRTGG